MGASATNKCNSLQYMAIVPAVVALEHLYTIAFLSSPSRILNVHCSQPNSGGVKGYYIAHGTLLLRYNI